MKPILFLYFIFFSLSSFGQHSANQILAIESLENTFPKRENGFYRTLNDYLQNKIAYRPKFKLTIGSAKLHRIEFPRKSKPSEGQVYRNTACVVLNDTLYIKSRKYKKSYMKVLLSGKLSLVPFNPAGDVWVPVFFSPWISVMEKVNHSSSYGTVFNLENGHYFNFTPNNFRKFLLRNDQTLYSKFSKIEDPSIEEMIPFLLEYNKKYQDIFK